MNIDDAWIQTFTKKKFNVFRPRVEDVDIIDIAHALAHQCRFGGHASQFYSVAEHSVHASRFGMGNDEKLNLLLHDSAEAYLVDLPAPIKWHIGGYRDLENRILSVIAEKFDIDVDVYDPYVKEVDKGLLAYEGRILMGLSDPHSEWPGLGEYKELKVELGLWIPELAKDIFLKVFRGEMS